MNLKTGLLTLGIAVSALWLFGCGGSSGSPLPDPTVRFINLSPDATLDLLSDDDTLFTNVAFGATTTNFVAIESEERDFGITQTGSSILLDAVTGALASDSDTLAIAFGLNNFGTENEKRLRLTFTSVNRRTPNATKARVYAFNAYVRATGNQNFAVLFKNPGTVSAINFNAVDFGQSASLEIDAGPTTLVAQRQLTETEVATVTKNFEAGKVYLMVLAGIEGTTGATAPEIKFIEISTRS